MNNASEIIFTIAIPTYNRSKFLDRCLNNIFEQKDFDKFLLQVIVSDNASTDDTKEIIDSYILRGFGIEYYLNEKNEGPDYNIAQCYLKSKGKYVLALGDDDVLLNGSIKNIIKFLENTDYGVVYLTPTSFKGEFIKDKNIVEIVDVNVFNTKEAFVSRVNYNLTFISSAIINRSALGYVDICGGMATHFIQLFPIITALKHFDKNAIIKTVLVAGQEDNTGGYNLYNIFGTSLSAVVNKLLPEKESIILKRLIFNNLNIGFFPFFTFKLKDHNNSFSKSAIKKAEIIKILKGNFYFWIFCLPILYLPKFLAKYYMLFSVLYGKIYYKSTTYFYNK